MKSSLVITLADEVTAKLDGLDIAGKKLSAVRKLIVEQKLPSTRDLFCICVPHALESKIITRGKTKERIIAVDVGIFKRCQESEIADLVTLVETVGDLLESATYKTGVVLGVEYAPIYDVNMFLQQGTFFARLSVNFKVFCK